MTRPKILLVHQSLRPPGGANAVGAWTLNALKDAFSVTLLTWDKIDVSALNQFYGTAIRPGDFSVLHPPPYWRTLRSLDPDHGSLIPAAALMRTSRRLSSQFDLVVGTAQEELDLGDRALLYIHHPDLGRFWGRYRDARGRPTLANALDLLRGRSRPWIVLSGFTMDRVRHSVLCTNSDWTGEQVRRIYGAPTRTIYPPVPCPTSVIPWTERENGFIASGRFNRRKRLDWIVRVLSRVRELHADITLHLVGTREPLDNGPQYFHELQKLAAQNSSWMTIHENLSRERLSMLTGRLRYGIHAQVDEHFGLAPAEALMAGCIPFVHDSGGQVEISGRDARLCFSSEEDAVDKISAVLIDAGEQSNILRYLAPRRQIFTAGEFTAALQSLVWQALRSSSPRVPETQP